MLATAGWLSFVALAVLALPTGRAGPGRFAFSQIVPDLKGTR